MGILMLGKLRNQILEKLCATFSRSRGCSKQLRYISLCHLFTLRSGLKVPPRSLYLVLNLLSRGSLDDGQRLLPRFATENGFQGFSREVNQGSRVSWKTLMSFLRTRPPLIILASVESAHSTRLENNWRAGPESNLGPFLSPFFFIANVNQNSKSLSCPCRSDGVSRLIPSRLRSRSTFVLQRSRSKSCSKHLQPSTTPKQVRRPFACASLLPPLLLSLGNLHNIALYAIP